MRIETLYKLSIFDTLTLEDNKLLKLLAEAKDHKNILDLFARRINLYKQCIEQTHDPIEKAIIEAKKMVVMGEVGLLSSQYDIQSKLDKIDSRLESLEKEVHRNLDRKSS
jgi:hypothetical protein